MKIYSKWFYQNNNVTATQINHRHFKVVRNGSWIKLFQNRDINELKSRLVYFEPEAVYISVSTYLDPAHVGMKYNMQGKAGFKVHQNIILSTDFVIDIDDEFKEEDGKKVKINPTEALSQLYWALSPEFEDFFFIVTKRGFHVWVNDFYDKRCRGKGALRPHEREQFLLSEKRRLAEQLLSFNCKFDYNVTIDTRRVVRLAGSLHNDQFTICSLFTDKDEAIKCYIQRHNGNDKRCSGGAGQMRRNVYEGEEVIKGSSDGRTPDLSSQSSEPSHHPSQYFSNKKNMRIFSKEKIANDVYAFI